MGEMPFFFPSAQMQVRLLFMLLFVHLLKDSIGVVLSYYGQMI